MLDACMLILLQKMLCNNTVIARSDPRHNCIHMELKTSTYAFFMVVESKLKANKHTSGIARLTTKSDISTSLFPQESMFDEKEKVKNTSILLISFAALCVIFEIIKGQSLMQVSFKYSHPF